MVWSDDVARHARDANFAGISMTRPHIFVTAEQIDGLRSVEDIRRNIRSGHARRLWESQLTLANQELRRSPYEPGDIFPGRDVMSARHANRDYTIVHRAGTRALRAALACLITGESRYRDDALAQMEALFDTNRWPEWRDLAHTGMNIDLRAGQLSRSLALAYDWLHPFINADQRQWIVEGIDACGIQPYFKDVAAGVRWANGTNNWMTCIVVDYAHPRLNAYFDNYGPEGEFNESVGYANAHALPLLYFSAHRYASRGGVNRLAEFPIPDACKWMMYFTVPPGHIVPFGDSHIGRPPSVPMFAAVADASRDPTLQWFYLEHSSPDDPDSDPWELLWYDPTLEPRKPDFPLGRAYHGHSQNISVRSSWNPRSTTCVVYGKGGHGAEGHGNHDAGQVCIDGYAQRLITDPGTPPGYPADFFGESRYQYYNASVFGHNVLTFGGREMRREKTDKATVTESEFDDHKGGWWQIDLTALYDEVHSVRRTVVFLAPSTVVVFDSALLESATETSLRWHTACEPVWRLDGHFSVENEGSAVDCLVTSFGGAELACALCHHKYVEPYNRFRLGDALEQRREPYVEFLITSERVNLMSLFKIRENGGPRSRWATDASTWHNGNTVVSCDGSSLMVACGGDGWEVTVGERAHHDD